MKRLNVTGLGFLLATCALIFPVAGAAGPTSVIVDDDEDEKAEEEEEDEEDEEDKDRYLAIVGADVYTGSGAVLRRATVLSKNGKIEEIGYEVDVPEEARVVEAQGFRVYPGLVAVSSSGLLGGSSDFENSVDPFNSRMILALGGGITTTGQGNSAAKLKRFEIEGVVLNDKVFASFSWSNRSPSGKRSTREKFQKAAEYLRGYRTWEVEVKKDKKLKEPSKKGVDSSALSVLKGTTRAKFRASDRDELLGIAHLAQEFGFQPVIEGAVEGWTVADELGRAGATVVLTPRTRRTKSELLSTSGGSSIENAAILHGAGVQIAIVPQSKGVDLSGIVGRDILHLPIEAGFAIRGGLSEQAAFEAITIVPARILGIAHRVGSLEVGKDCDLIITDGDILHYETFVQWSVVDGKVVYDKEKELYYAHIRPRPPVDTELAPESKVDPGEEGADEESESDEDEDDDKDDDEGEGDDDEGEGDDDEEDDEEEEEDDEEEDDEEND